MGVVSNKWQRNYQEVIEHGRVYHVFTCKIDAASLAHDYAYAGWRQVDYKGQPAWTFKLTQPKAGGSGWVR
jgi:hypothetical protein